MGEFSTVGDISQAKPNISGRPDPTQPLNYFQDIRDVGAGWADENIFGLAFQNLKNFKLFIFYFILLVLKIL